MLDNGGVHGQVRFISLMLKARAERVRCKRSATYSISSQKHSTDHGWLELVSQNPGMVRRIFWY